MQKLFAVLLALALPVVALPAPPNTWAINHAPAAATKPTITRAAGGANVRHTATSITVCAVGVAAQGPITFNLRDGATGAGTVLWTATVSAPIGQSVCVSPAPVNIVGSRNTAMTLEAAAAPAATNFATVSLTGYTEYSLN